MQNIIRVENIQEEFSPILFYNKFVERIQVNLHIVLAFSPIGDKLKNFIRIFPSIVNCTMIDWFSVNIKIF